MRHRRNGYRKLRRVCACALGLLLVGFAASPAWAAPPDAPAKPGVTAGDTQIVVTFTAPFDGGSPITAYVADCTSGDGGAFGTATDNAPTDPAAPITVTGLTNGSTYTCAVTATNADGTGSPSLASDPVIPAAVPDAPAQPGVAPGDSQIVVTFATPADNGSTITSYTATCTDGVTPTAQSGTASPITVTGLANGTSYTCTVFAHNAMGDGPASPDSAAVVPAAVPDAPAAPGATVGDSQIVVTFTAPADNGSAITSYTATCTSGNGGTTGTATDNAPTDPASPITVSGLDNGSTYTCKVKATNAAGTGANSLASAAVIPAGVPFAPAQPSVTRGNHLIVVTFAVPNSNGRTITSYTATCTDGVTPASHSGTGSPLTVSGLTNGNSYTCTVFAHNAIGDGPASPASVAVVPAAVPGAPAAPTVARGNAQIVVTFIAPADNGTLITDYTASCVSSNGGTPGTKHGAASPLTVIGLSNGHLYTCKVKATNAVGTGPASPASAAVQPATVPVVPTIGVAASGNGTASVAFTSGGGNGSPITSFGATCTSSNGGATGTGTGSASPVTVTGLTIGNIYTCTATATNAVGTSAASAPSPAFVEGQPGSPTAVAVVPGNASGSTGPLKVVFTPGPDNGHAITQYGASCVSTNGGVPGSATATSSPVTVPALTTGKTYNCTAYATNSIGTSRPSLAARGTVGTPAPVQNLRALPIKNGVALPFATPFNNGATITSYRARCVSSNGGTPGSPLQYGSPIVATSLTNGKSYTCTVTANNSRGEGAATVTSPFVAGPLPVKNRAVCSGTTGTLTATPGFLLKVQQLQTSTLTATYSSCTGPYVSAGKITMSFRTAVPGMSCQKALNITNAGYGSFTWTSPLNMGKSAASARWLITSSTGHTTTLHYYGSVTARANVFTDVFFSGDITLDKGLHATAFGGDCSATKPITSFNVKAISLTVS